jgi:tetratricopeptide (TPR) repeat protein
MALTPQRAGRRRLARGILVALVFLHGIALLAYILQNRQQLTIVRFLDARSAWRDDHLDDAAAAYRSLLNDRDRIAFPIILVRHYPSRADIAYLLGRVESDRHHVDAALAAYAISLQDGGRGDRETRDLLLSNGRASLLLSRAQSAHASHPEAPQPLKDEGAALLALQRPADAAAAYRAALDRLPAWRRQIDPGAPPGLSGEEADLWNLESAAALQAGNIAAAEAACDQVSSRQTGTAPLDHLCRALLAEKRGHRAEAVRLLQGYLPPAPEHEALLHDLLPQP